MRFRTIVRQALAFAIGFCLFSESGLAFEVQQLRTEGFYLAPRDNPDFVPSPIPLAGLNPAEIMAYYKANPEMCRRRVILALGNLRKGKDVLRDVRAALTAIGVEPKVKLIRWPDGSFLDSIVDLKARGHDWQKPIPAEIKLGHGLVFGGEALSMTWMTYLMLTHQLGILTGSASIALDLVQQSVFAYPLRFWSNYQGRQSGAKQFLMNLLIGAVFSSNFYLLMNAQALYNAPSLLAMAPNYVESVAPGTVISAIWGFVGVVAFRWENSGLNRMALDDKRTFRSNILLAQQILLSPFYIYSVSPLAKSLFELKAFSHHILDVNLGHIVVLSAGLIAAAILPFAHKLAAKVSDINETSSVAGACVRLLSGAGFRRSVGDRPATTP